MEIAAFQIIKQEKNPEEPYGLWLKQEISLLENTIGHSSDQNSPFIIKEEIKEENTTRNTTSAFNLNETILLHPSTTNSTFTNFNETVLLHPGTTKSKSDIKSSSITAKLTPTTQKPFGMKFNENSFKPKPQQAMAPNESKFEPIETHIQ